MFSSTNWRPYTPLPVLPTREEMLTAICNRENIRSFAEVGVKQGYFAEQVLARCANISNYIGVDMWASQEFYDDGANVKDSDQERFYQETRARLEHFSGRWQLMRDDSIHAATTIPDGSLDFVYLDARHDYRSVQEDIRAWAPKVRHGGILSGHDYLDAKEAKGVGGWVRYKDGSVSHSTKAVRSAVTEFAESTNRQLVCTYSDLWECMPFPSWFMRM